VDAAWDVALILLQVIVQLMGVDMGGAGCCWQACRLQPQKRMRRGKFICRKANHSQTEVDNMLESLRECLPIFGLEWELMAQCHVIFHPDQECNDDQLKKKFNSSQRQKCGQEILTCLMMCPRLR